MSQLVAVILTYNEAHNVDWCVLSLRPYVDAVVVWDSGSPDGTVERAQRAGALVVQRPFDDYARQRQAALLDLLRQRRGPDVKKQLHRRGHLVHVLPTRALGADGFDLHLAGIDGEGNTHMARQYAAWAPV